VYLRIPGDAHIKMRSCTFLISALFLFLVLASCLPATTTVEQQPVSESVTTIASETPAVTPTTVAPGELVEYVAQSGDTLSALAARFNTSIEEILSINPEIPPEVTTLPSGMPMSIPAYFLPLLGSPFHIVPDSEIIYGPSAVAFDTRQEIEKFNGFLATMTEYVDKRQRASWEVIDAVALDYSIHPRIFLTLLEYQSQAVTKVDLEEKEITYPLGYEDPLYKGLYRQLQWAAELLNNGYYGWRTGFLREIYLNDGRLTRPDPWQNAGTVAIQNFFAALNPLESFEDIVGAEGFVSVYWRLWGDPYSYEIEIMPANLQQPTLTLPFMPSRIWDFSAGPHYSWGTSLPYGALDFAPPAVEGGCATSDEWITAPVEGVITRSEDAKVALDLDGDGDERTGWVLFFFHVADDDRIPDGSQVAVGDLIGHPSCEGGRATGTHFHIARKYNGEWIPAAGELAFNLDGWVVQYGEEPYLGTMTKGSKVVQASTCTTSENQIIYEFP
jgi:LasA protease